MTPTLFSSCDLTLRPHPGRTHRGQLPHRGRRHPHPAMAYNGTASPEYYGLHYQNLGTTNLACAGHEPAVYGDRPGRELLAVSAGYLMSRRPGAWTLTPWTAPHAPEMVVGHSIFVYDITRNPDLHLRIARRYLGLGLTQEFRRHSRRISAIVPDDPEPLPDTGALVSGGRTHGSGAGRGGGRSQDRTPARLTTRMACGAPGAAREVYGRY